MASDAGKRPRSTRYPGVSLVDALEFVRTVDARGLAGLSSAELAAALGVKNVRTNTFSARLSAARQFGLLSTQRDGFAPTPLARSILHPADPSEVSRQLRQALVEPPLYASLVTRYTDKVVPEAAVLANVLLHHEGITASAKETAASNFLDSARFAGALGDDRVLHPRAPDGTTATETRSSRPPKFPAVRIDLRLWGPDEGKTVRLRAPALMTEQSLERLIQTIRLMVRVEP